MYLCSRQEEAGQTNKESQLCPGMPSWPSGGDGRGENVSQATIYDRQPVLPGPRRIPLITELTETTKMGRIKDFLNFILEVLHCLQNYCSWM